MQYEHENPKFGFDLPDGWQRAQHVLPLTFHGPNGRPGLRVEVIQVEFGGISAGYKDSEAREQYLAEPGAQIFRSSLGDEDNCVVLKRESNSEISAVRDGIHYQIAHSNDEVTLQAIELLRTTARFPTSTEAAAAIKRAAAPGAQAVAAVLRTGSAEEARQILSDAGMPPVGGGPGYTMHRVAASDAPAHTSDARRPKKWWQFWISQTRVPRCTICSQPIKSLRVPRDFAERLSLFARVDLEPVQRCKACGALSHGRCSLKRRDDMHPASGRSAGQPSLLEAVERARKGDSANLDALVEGLECISCGGWAFEEAFCTSSDPE